MNLFVTQALLVRWITFVKVPMRVLFFRREKQEDYSRS
jgi:hypothetical protein